MCRKPGSLSWNLTTRKIAEQMNDTCATFPYEVDEFEMAKLTKAPSRLVRPPRVAESPVNFECKVTEIVQMKRHTGAPVQAWLVLGEVVGVHIDDKLLPDGVFDTFNADIILRAGGASAYAHITPDTRFDMKRPA